MLKPTMCECGHTYDAHHRDGRGWGCCLSMACACSGPHQPDPPTDRSVRVALKVAPCRPEHYKQYCVCYDCIVYREYHDIPLGWLPDTMAGLQEHVPIPNTEHPHEHPSWCMCGDCLMLGELDSSFMKAF